jgi:hypothetical protein
VLAQERSFVLPASECHGRPKKNADSPRAGVMVNTSPLPVLRQMSKKRLILYVKQPSTTPKTALNVRKTPGICGNFGRLYRKNTLFLDDLTGNPVFG